MFTYRPGKLRKDQGISVCGTQHGEWQFYLWQTHKTHKDSNAKSQNFSLLQERKSPCGYPTEESTDRIWYYNSLQEKEKPINLPIYLSELRKKKTTSTASLFC